MSQTIDAVPERRTESRSITHVAVTDGARPPAFTTQQLVLLTGITLVATILRLYKLGEWSLWVDEAHTFRDAVAPSASFWESDLRNYPLSFLMLRGLFSLGMPTSEGWLRLPFVFFGIMSVPALAILGRIMVGRRAALLAALLLAVSPWHIFWSQNARSYSVVLFFVLIAAGAFYDGMLRRSPVYMIVGLAITVVAGLFHPSAYILLGGLAAFGFIAFRDPELPKSRALKWLPVISLGVLAVIVFVLLPLLERIHQGKAEFSLMHLVQTMVFFVRTPLIVAAIGGMLLLFERRHLAAPFLLCWVAVPVVVLAILATGIVKVTAQYAFYTLPAFCLLAAVVVRALADGVKGEGFRGTLLRVVPLGILLLDMAGQSVLYFDKYYGERPRWREAAEFVMSQQGAYKRVLTTNGPSLTYYMNVGGFDGISTVDRRIDVRALADYMIEKGGGTQFMEQHVEAAAQEGVDLYVVLTEPELDEMDPGGMVDTYLRDHFFQRRRYPNWTGPKDMSVLVYRFPRQRPR